MAPVWEANHVWLVFVLIITWTGFPQVFEAVVSTTWVAVILGGLGIVLRGAGFAFRKPTLQAARRRRYGTRVRPGLDRRAVLPRRGARWRRLRTRPGRQPRRGPGDLVAQPDVRALRRARGRRRRRSSPPCSWPATPAGCGEPDLEGYFRRRAVAAGTAVLVVALAGLLVLRADARHVFDGLLAGWGLVFAVDGAGRHRGDGRAGGAAASVAAPG